MLFLHIPPTSTFSCSISKCSTAADDSTTAHVAPLQNHKCIICKFPKKLWPLTDRGSALHADEILNSLFLVQPKTFIHSTKAQNGSTGKYRCQSTPKNAHLINYLKAAGTLSFNGCRHAASVMCDCCCCVCVLGGAAQPNGYNRKVLQQTENMNKEISFNYSQDSCQK